MTRPLLFALCLLALGGGACGDDEGVDESAYIAANEAILEALPKFPGAEQIETTNAPYYEGDGADAPVAGYTTNAVLRAPEGASAGDVVGFYENELGSDWESQREESPIIDQPTGRQIGTVVTATFTRDGVRVSVNTDGMATGGSTFEVGVDSGGQRRG